MSEQTDNKIEEAVDEERKFGDVSDEEIETAKDGEPEDMKEGFDLKTEILEWLESFVFAMFIVQLIFIFMLRIVMVDGDSMNNTLINGDRLIMTHMNYTPERDDIIVINSEAINKIIIKRVIGIEGDKVVIDYNNNHVFVNDVQISNEHIKEIMVDRGFFDLSYMVGSGVYEYTVPEDCVFVMGDNRNDSKDSRSIGFINEDTIMGKAVFRIYPMNEFGSVK